MRWAFDRIAVILSDAGALSTDRLKDIALLVWETARLGDWCHLDEETRHSFRKQRNHRDAWSDQEALFRAETAKWDGRLKRQQQIASPPERSDPPKPTLPLGVLVVIADIERKVRQLLEGCCTLPDGLPATESDVAKATKFMRSGASEAFRARAEYYESQTGFCREWLEEAAEETVAETLNLAPLRLLMSSRYQESGPAIGKELRKILQALLEERMSAIDKQSAGNPERQVSDRSSERSVSDQAPRLASGNEAGTNGNVQPRRVKQTQHTSHTERRLSPEDTSSKGSLKRLCRADGSRYESVDFPTAEKYAAITPRRRQQLLKSGVLVSTGRGRNRRVTVESLIAYCPPAEDAK